jgi:hypothetical protein
LAFDVQISERDEAFLLTCRGIPEETRDRLLMLAWGQLTTIGEAERLDPQGRLPDNPDCFYHHVLFLADGRIKTLRFVVDDSGAAASVLRIVYVDLIEGKELRRFQ